MPAFVAYHGVTGAEHQRRVDELSQQGYRPTSLSVAGDPADARYSAVWVQRPGPGWWAVHGIAGADFQGKFDEITAHGYAPRVISATGAAGSEIFAALFEQGVELNWFARHGLRWGADGDPDTIAGAQKRAFDGGFIPLSLTAYGTAGDRRFAGVWVKNVDAVLWSWWWTNEASYQRFFDALVAGGMRPACLAVADDGNLLSVFRGDQIGAWWASHGLDGDGYQAEFDTRVAGGARPILVQAGGGGGDTRYAAIFAGDDATVPRTWSVTGGAVAGAAALDEAVRLFMVKYGVRALSVAVARNGVELAARGYTWAEPGYPVTRPDTRFRIASVSKAFAAAEVTELVARGVLTWPTAAFPLLGITAALPTGTTSDPAMNSITVQDLVLRTSRLPRDFPLQQRDIAAALGIGTAPLTRDALLRYLYGQALLPSVPTGGTYSNTAFYALTSVVEQSTGLDFLAALNRDVLGPMGITDVGVAGTRIGAGSVGEVATYDHADVRSSQFDFAPDVLAPNAYGGEFVLETGAGAGGLVTSAATMARLVGRYPVWNGSAANLTGRELGTRYGTLDGASSGAVSRGDGRDMAFALNRRVTDPQHDEIRDAINAVLDANPF